MNPKTSHYLPAPSLWEEKRERKLFWLCLMIAFEFSPSHVGLVTQFIFGIQIQFKSSLICCLIGTYHFTLKFNTY